MDWAAIAVAVRVRVAVSIVLMVAVVERVVVASVVVNDIIAVEEDREVGWLAVVEVAVVELVAVFALSGEVVASIPVDPPHPASTTVQASAITDNERRIILILTAVWY